MTRLLGALLMGMVVVALAVAPQLRPSGDVASAAAPGPTIGFGTPTLVSGKVEIPVLASGSGFSPYVGFTVHLRWNPAVFSFSSATAAGGLFGSAAICPPADSTTFDADGGGVQFSCSKLGGNITTGGLLATVTINPLAAGCSRVHLFTYGLPDGGDSGTGTYTVNDVDFTPQANPYGADLAIDQASAACTPPGSPTATATATLTPTATSTPTSTSTPTATSTAITGAPDVTVAAASVPAITDSGTMIAYNVTVSNVGDAPATAVTLDFGLPLGAVPFKNGFCKIWVAGHFDCKLPNLAANDHAPGGPDQVSLVLNVQMPITMAALVANVPVRVAAGNEPPANNANNTVVVTTGVRGCPDITGDGVINILDLSRATLAIGLHTGQPGFDPLLDLNNDGVITIADLAIMGSSYGAHCRGLDRDHDGLTDPDEVNLYLTNPLVPDTDGDGLPDGVEVLTYGSNPLNPETSGDGYTDGEKVALGTDPTIYCPIMASDINKDQVVNVLDLSIAAVSFGKHTGDSGFNPRADTNKDGVVNILDLSFMAASYGKSVLLCP